MAYKSERFDPGEITGLQKAWDTVDLFNGNHVPVVSEVMAGTSYRRQLHSSTLENLGNINYLLQVTLEPEIRTDGRRLHARPYLNRAVELLRAVEMPGEVHIDEGGLNGWDITTTKEHPFGTGTTETETLQIYPPWLQARWEEAGKSCMFFLGILPPKPKDFMEDWMFEWDERILKSGMVIFEPTPSDLKTW